MAVGIRVRKSNRFIRLQVPNCHGLVHFKQYGHVMSISNDKHSYFTIIISIITMLSGRVDLYSLCKCVCQMNSAWVLTFLHLDLYQNNCRHSAPSGSKHRVQHLWASCCMSFASQNENPLTKTECEVKCRGWYCSDGEQSIFRSNQQQQGVDTVTSSLCLSRSVQMIQTHMDNEKNGSNYFF